MLVSSTAEAAEVRDAIHRAYPKLQDAGGFEYLKANSLTKRLEVVPCPDGGFGAAQLKAITKQARLYLHPVQTELSLDVCDLSMP